MATSRRGSLTVDTFKQPKMSMKPQKLGNRETGLTVKGNGRFETAFFESLSKTDLRDPCFNIPEPLKNAQVVMVEGQGKSKQLKESEINMSGFKNTVDIKLESPFDLFLERGMLVQKRRDVKDTGVCPCCYFEFEADKDQLDCWESHLSNFHEMVKINVKDEVLYFVKRERFQQRAAPPPAKKECLECAQFKKKIKELEGAFKFTQSGLGDVLANLQKFVETFN